MYIFMWNMQSMYVHKEIYRHKTVANNNKIELISQLIGEVLL